MLARMTPALAMSRAATAGAASEKLWRGRRTPSSGGFDRLPRIEQSHGTRAQGAATVCHRIVPGAVDLFPASICAAQLRLYPHMKSLIFPSLFNSLRTKIHIR